MNSTRIKARTIQIATAATVDAVDQRSSPCASSMTILNGLVGIVSRSIPSIMYPMWSPPRNTSKAMTIATAAMAQSINNVSIVPGCLRRLDCFMLAPLLVRDGSAIAGSYHVAAAMTRQLVYQEEYPD